MRVAPEHAQWLQGRAAALGVPVSRLLRECVKAGMDGAERAVRSGRGEPETVGPLRSSPPPPNVQDDEVDPWST